MTRLTLLLALLPACQCLVPVNEDAGGVMDAAVDAGRDAGIFISDGGAECRTAADCAMAPWSSRWCVFGIPAGLSCVEQHCISECAGDAGRTCTFDAGPECMECSTETPVCNGDTCPTAAFSATVSSMECRQSFAPPFNTGEMLSFVPLHGASCEMSVISSTTGVGYVTRSAQDGRHFWFIRELGGWCVGEQLATGAIRSMVACPLCTFGVEGF
jgi:hypothetical protein